MKRETQLRQPTGGVSAAVPGYAAGATEPPRNGNPGADRLAGGREEPINPSKQPMKLSDLIKRIGDDYVVLQNVLHSSPDIRDGKKEGRIAFSTDKTKAQDLMHQAAMGKRGRWTALIVWLPNDRIDSLDGAERAGSQAPDDSQASPHNESTQQPPGAGTKDHE